MGDQFDFSLLIGSQYDGGPMEWDEQTLYVSSGTILNHVDINKVCSTVTNWIATFLNWIATLFLGYL